MKIRTLYDCYHARYPTTGDYVVCEKGYDFGKRVNKLQVDRNDRLAFRRCQLCVDFLDMNVPLTRFEVDTGCSAFSSDCLGCKLEECSLMTKRTWVRTLNKGERNETIRSMVGTMSKIKVAKQLGISPRTVGRVLKEE